MAGGAGEPHESAHAASASDQGQATDAAIVAGVRAFLDASASRDPAAGRALAHDVELIFPIGRFGSLDELQQASRDHYRYVRKTYLTWDVAHHADGSVVVVSTGTLSGENRHGGAFHGIRYIDRFTLRGGAIVRHEVWNDLAISGVLDRREPDLS